MRRSALILAVVILLLQSAAAMAQKVVELGVYKDWRGDNCTFKSAYPFFIIRDLYDLERFWQQAGADEPMPAIDFTKCMLLVWAPGATMFDYRPAVVERFLYQDGFYIVVMDIARKDSGGFWRRPFVATLLPSKTGDIFIMRKAVIGSKVELKPLYTIWDMSGERTRPFEVARIATPPEPPKFIDHGGPASRSMVVQRSSASSSAGSPATAEATTSAVRQPTAAVATPATAAAVAQPSSAQTATAWEEENPFGIAPVAKTETVAQPASQPKQPTTPTFAEDPLFGTEFDIEF
ncbi:MAG: hypothetical protein CVV41_16970 [Candidatus Riflebacteria bacterium HGW-Riflebacteria-1]|jgi:hypothetical protein|nr:MAG: hypothetical protein CVV41_16970 [Candidatus Riflebacteria bacterium HGW-Riflebacteria-1]